MKWLESHGKWLLLAGNYLAGIGIPAAVLAAVLGGTETHSVHTYTLNGLFALPFYLLLLCGLLDIYIKRFEPFPRRQTLSFMLLAVLLSAIIIVLSLPHLPLSSRWHAPAPQTNIALLMMVELPLLIGMLIVRRQPRKQQSKP